MGSWLTVSKICDDLKRAQTKEPLSQWLVDKKSLRLKRQKGTKATQCMQVRDLGRAEPHLDLLIRWKQDHLCRLGEAWRFKSPGDRRSSGQAGRKIAWASDWLVGWQTHFPLDPQVLLGSNPKKLALLCQTTQSLDLLPPVKTIAHRLQLISFLSTHPEESFHNVPERPPSVDARRWRRLRQQSRCCE